MAASRASVEPVVRQVAAQRGFPDVELLLAVIDQESGFDPAAVGDSGHSIGLFQEHDRGRGAGLSTEQRQDVAAATNRAIDEFLAVRAKNPTADRGTWAALAQRPLDAKGYATAINAKLSAPSSGGYAWPVPGAWGSGITNPFGAKQVRSQGSTVPLRDTNVGMDIGAPVGTTVAAPVSGAVTRVVRATADRDPNDNGGYGEYVAIQGDDGREHLLAHMGRGSATVSPGQRVQAGQPIGRVGLTGNTTGPHVNWEAKGAKGYEDPAAFGGRGPTSTNRLAQGGLSTPPKPDVSGLLAAIASVNTTTDNVRAALEELSSTGSGFDYNAQARNLLASVGLSADPAAPVELRQPSTPKTGTIAPKGANTAMATNQQAGTPADVLQAYFNMVLALSQQAIANVAQTGYVPQMIWDPSAYNGIGGFVPTGNAVETMGLVQNRLNQNRSQMSALATIAGSAGRVPMVEVDDKGYLYQAYDPLTGEPIYLETDASKARRQSAGQAVGYISGDLLTNQPLPEGWKKGPAPGENMMADQKPIGISQQSAPAPAPAPNAAPAAEPVAEPQPQGLPTGPHFLDPNANMQFPSGPQGGSAYPIVMPGMDTPENQAWLAEREREMAEERARLAMGQPVGPPIAEPLPIGGLHPD